MRESRRICAPTIPQVTRSRSNINSGFDHRKSTCRPRHGPATWLQSCAPRTKSLASWKSPPPCSEWCPTGPTTSWPARLTTPAARQWLASHPSAAPGSASSSASSRRPISSSPITKPASPCADGGPVVLAGACMPAERALPVTNFAFWFSMPTNILCLYTVIWCCCYESKSG